MRLEDYKKIFESLTTNGWMDFEEGEILIRYAEKTIGPMVEIGSYMGRSAVLLAQLGRTVFCVDPWDDYFHTELKGEQIYQKFLENTRHCTNIVPVRSKVEDWEPVKAGYVYIDGDHTYEGTKRAILKAAQCKPRFIAGHDVNNEGEGVEVSRAFWDTMGTPVERAGKTAIFQLW